MLNPSEVTEGGAIFFPVRLSRPANRLVRIAYETRNGTATWPDDYLKRSGTLRFRPGKTRKLVRVPTTEDGAFEDIEQFTMRISRAPAGATSSATVARPTATAKISDNDTKPALSISDAQSSEGTGSPGQMLFNVQLSKAAGTRVSAQFATANDTATASIDYTASSGSVSFLAGETAKQIAVPLTGDAFDEPNETLAVNLSNPFGATIADGQGQGTILDDETDCIAPDSPPGTNIGSVSGDSNTGPATLQRVDAISPCGDTDWFQSRMTEDNNSSVSLGAVVFLETTPNGTPNGGDLDLCVRADNATTGIQKCSTLSAGATEQVCVFNDDDFMVDDSTNFFIEVKGFGQASNGYTLTVVRNQAPSMPQTNCAVGA